MKTRCWKSLSLVNLLLMAGLAAAAPAPKVKVDEAPVQRSAATSFAGVIKKASPSVVSVYSTKTVRNSASFFGEGTEEIPDDPFFRRFFGDPRQPQQPRRERGLGSGVVISEDGYILTNNHVVEGADEVEVTFSSGSERVTAKVVGADPPTDIAVLKVDRKGLTPITLADSEKLEVGDQVLAIGNPFGVGQTVTMGIVSAVGRGGVGILPYEDFIQTDASINPGNSGGALIDTDGRLVGINTLILSRSGGNQGIGFAVPINIARWVMNQVLKDGKVSRGFLGIKPREITPDLAREFKLNSPTGALVVEVSPGTPAESAGIKEDDIITEFNNVKVRDDRHLRLLAAQTPPKTKVPVKYSRDGKDHTVNVTLGELPLERTGKGHTPRRGAPEQHEDIEGLELSDLNPRVRRQMGIPSAVQGALVAQVAPGSEAEDANLQPGFVITEVDHKPVKSANEALEEIQNSKDGRAYLRLWIPTGDGAGSRDVTVLRLPDKSRK